MRIQPPPSSLRFPTAEQILKKFKEDRAELIATGGIITPAILLSAYIAGAFPMPISPEGKETILAWWSPNPRGILPVESFRPSRSLRKSCSHYHTTINHCFEQVIDNCSNPDRPGGWITPEIKKNYIELHKLGWAFSIETWQDSNQQEPKLVGGLYGVSIGGLFAGESMFHKSKDASKVALVKLVEIMSQIHNPLIDVQWATPHLKSLGAIEISRTQYVKNLQKSLACEPPKEFS